MFARVPSSPAVDYVSVIPASVIDAWASMFPDALDTAGGGAYSIMPAHTITFQAGGGDWAMSCPFYMTDAYVPSGGQLTFQSGSAGVVASGAGYEIDGVLQVRGGGVQNFLSGSALNFKSGSTTIGEVGSVLTLRGSLLIENGSTGLGTITLGGASHAGHLVCTSLGDITIQSGGAMSVAGGVSWASGGTATFLSGSSLTLNSGSTTSDASTRTRTGSETLSGTGAWTAKRTRTIPITTNPITISPWEADIWSCPALSGNQTIVCAQAPAGVTCTFIITGNPATIGNHTLFVEDDANVSIGKLVGDASAPTGKERGTIEYFYPSDQTARILSVSTTSGGTYAVAPS